MSEMSNKAQKEVERYMAVPYPFNVHADPEGGFVVVFPDLPRPATHVRDLTEVGPAAEEIKALWIETELEEGRDIPEPSHPEEYSGRFNLRLPRSLHRALSEAAALQSVSLNTYVHG